MSSSASKVEGGSQPRVAGIILAGGSSSRLGQPKQLLELERRPLLQHAVDAAERAGLDEVVVVLGHRAEEVERAIDLSPTTRIVVNPNYLEGQATSLRAGLRALADGVDAALVTLGDQPAVTSERVRSVLKAYRATRRPVVQATYGGRPAHPVLFDRAVWGDLLAVEGDLGAREVLRNHPELIHRVEVGGDVPGDVDTWDDYERLKRIWSS